MDKKINIWKVLKMNRIRWDVDMENNIIVLDGGEVIKFKYIIGADGAIGITKGLVDENIKANGFCLQIEIVKENQWK